MAASFSSIRETPWHGLMSTGPRCGGVARCSRSSTDHQAGWQRALHESMRTRERALIATRLERLLAVLILHVHDAPESTLGDELERNAHVPR